MKCLRTPVLSTITNIKSPATDHHSLWSIYTTDNICRICFCRNGLWHTCEHGRYAKSDVRKCQKLSKKRLTRSQFKMYEFCV
uniref:Uncharacterized protein n=1 Tax=Pyxicephalus adspersus TaxID=30357 RepID=A0AAV3AC96_PYXAD|nr:TPA: hypothetical protein GDO54_012457 [Pyxicephalus adspersus]